MILTGFEVNAVPHGAQPSLTGGGQWALQGAIGYLLAQYVDEHNVGELIDNEMQRDGGYLVIAGGHDGRATETNIAGVFAAGDVADPVYRQVEK